MTTIGLIGSTRTGAPELASLLPADMTLRAFPSRIGAFPYTALERALQAVGHLDAAFAAAEAGCRAVVIDSVGDYGLDAMRSAIGVPAIGAGEAGLAEAAAGGRRFAVVTVWPASMNFIVEDRITACGRASSCTGIFNVGIEPDLDNLSGPDGYIARIHDGEAALLGRVGAAIADAAARGAEAVLLGCTCMSTIAERMAERSPLPVINPLAAGLREALAAGPVTPSRLRDDRRALVGAMVEAAATAGEAEACPICAPTTGDA